MYLYKYMYIYMQTDTSIHTYRSTCLPLAELYCLLPLLSLATGLAVRFGKPVVGLKEAGVRALNMPLQVHSKLPTMYVAVQADSNGWTAQCKSFGQLLLYHFA